MGKGIQRSKARPGVPYVDIEGLPVHLNFERGIYYLKLPLETLSSGFNNSHTIML
jgi:hypothetical protein